MSGWHAELMNCINKISVKICHVKLHTRGQPGILFTKAKTLGNIIISYRSSYHVHFFFFMYGYAKWSVLITTNPRIKHLAKMTNQQIKWRRIKTTGSGANLSNGSCMSLSVSVFGRRFPPIRVSPANVWNYHFTTMFLPLRLWPVVLCENYDLIDINYILQNNF